MRRREFITLIGGAAAWPIAARGQQRERMRLIGVLMSIASDDPEGQARLAAFLQGLQEWGWSVGRNVVIEIRWGAGDSDRYRKYAAELVALSPDTVLAGGGSTIPALQQASRTIPIVFANATDPVGSGYVRSLAQPGGNATGFALSEFATSGKLLELLKQIAPHITRVVVVRDPSLPSGSGQFGAIQGAASSLGVELSPADVRDTHDIERVLATLAQRPNGGLVVPPSAAAAVHRDLIIALAAQHRLPAAYPYRYYISAGGLIAYGSNLMEQYRQAAAYVDRIFKGENPAELPVQTPTKYELVVNMRTAKSLGLTVPATLLATADGVIE
jgi:putative ABC transport system substrate-binding protein